MWLFDLFCPQFCNSDMSRYGYLEVLQSPLEFEITRVDCIHMRCYFQLWLELANTQCWPYYNDRSYNLLKCQRILKSADMQARLSHHWTQMSVCTFSHLVTQMWVLGSLTLSRIKMITTWKYFTHTFCLQCLHHSLTFSCRKLVTKVTVIIFSSKYASEFVEERILCDLA